MQSLRAIAGEKDKSALWILLALFFWFLGYQGILPFVGKLCKDVFDIVERQGGPARLGRRHRPDPLRHTRRATSRTG